MGLFDFVKDIGSTIKTGLTNLLPSSKTSTASTKDDTIYLGYPKEETKKKTSKIKETTEKVLTATAAVEAGVLTGLITGNPILGVGAVATTATLAGATRGSPTLVGNVLGGEAAERTASTIQTGIEKGSDILSKPAVAATAGIAAGVIAGGVGVYEVIKDQPALTADTGVMPIQSTGTIPDTTLGQEPIIETPTTTASTMPMINIKVSPRNNNYINNVIQHI